MLTFTEREYEIMREQREAKKTKEELVLPDDYIRPTDEDIKQLILLEEKQKNEAVEVEVLEKQEGKGAIKKFKQRGKVQTTPTEKLTLIDMAIRRYTKEMQDISVTLKDLKRKRAKLTKLLTDLDNL